MIYHRLKPFEKRDCIFYLEGVQVLDQGTFNSYLKEIEQFKRMVQHG